MAYFQLIPARSKKEWVDVLALCGEFDTYHLPEFHILAEEQGEGEPYLFFFEDSQNYAALPLLLRRVAQVEGLENYQAMDATSVYGYPGIVSSISRENGMADIFLSKFQNALTQLFKELNIISFFSRLNPLINTSWLFQGMAEVVPLALTVAIDLSRSEDDQIKTMTKGHRYDIRKARRQGVVVRQDETFELIEDFVRVYNETMKRTGASKYYFFEKEHFFKLKEILGDSVKLFVAEKDDVIISASLFLATGKILQYHLSGTPEQYLQHGGSKVIIDDVRKWGKERSFAWFHLGGGVSSREDSLFRFKAGFSKSRYHFEIVKVVLQPDIYAELVHKRSLWEKENGMTSSSDNYFPKYRRPVSKQKI